MEFKLLKKRVVQMVVLHNGGHMRLLQLIRGEMEGSLVKVRGDGGWRRAPHLKCLMSNCSGVHEYRCRVECAQSLNDPTRHILFILTTYTLKLLSNASDDGVIEDTRLDIELLMELKSTADGVSACGSTIAILN